MTTPFADWWADFDNTTPTTEDFNQPVTDDLRLMLDTCLATGSFPGVGDG